MHDTLLERTKVFRTWDAPRYPMRFTTGVSLHGHTSHSREALKFLGGFKNQFPIIPAVLRIAGRIHRRATGEALDLGRVTWRPPLDPHTAHGIEARQLESLGLTPLVSLTDHDTIEANLELGRARTPESVEWTVPWGRTFFHLGVHNLPRRGGLWNGMQSVTKCPEEAGLRAMLAAIHEQPDTLVVLNHPLWDEACIGLAAHTAALASFLARCGEWIHAIELNGLRSRVENAAVTHLAAGFRKPLVAGGDRHGAEPNACINLTNASTFSEFVDEVRGGGRSVVVYLPQYREPLRLRALQTVWDIVRYYPEAPDGRRRWSDRFFYMSSDGADRPLAEVWKTAYPPVLHQTLSMLRIASAPRLQGALRFALAERGD